jgi:hypothetical protein
MVIINTNAEEVRIQAVSPELIVGGGAAAAKARAGKRVIKARSDKALRKKARNIFVLLTVQSSHHQSKIKSQAEIKLGEHLRLQLLCQ